MLCLLLAPAALAALAAPTGAALIYCDPVGYEGRYFREACEARGVLLVRLWSTPYAAMLSEDLEDAEERAAIQRGCAPAAGEEAAWAESALSGITVTGVLCGSDAGLATAERLQHALVPARTNGLVPARRDKYLMHEALRTAGLAAARQSVARSWEEARSFLSTLPPPLRVVLKPRRGHAGLRVGLASSEPQARHMVEALLAERVSLDTEAEGGALCQEVLEGEEWVVDTVSRAGEHKCVALWRYGKGEANGVDFGLLADVCVGHNAYDVTLDAYFDQAAWAALPALPPRALRGAGRLVKLVASEEGVLRAAALPPAGLESLVRWGPEPSEPGEPVALTVDNNSCAGYAWLLHADEAVVAADCAALHELQAAGRLFDVDSASGAES